jgi:two-component system CheB/CheR fusion protein
MVVFGVNNLVTDAPISRLDLVLCRNVFIYLDSELQKRVIMRFHYALRRPGVLGRSELIPFAAKLFQPLDISRRVYRKDDRKDLNLSPQSRFNAVVVDAASGGSEAGREEITSLPQHLKDILDSMPLPVIATGLDGDVTFWSAESARIWSRPAKDVVGKKISALGLHGLSGDLLIEKTAVVREGQKDRESADGVIAVAGQGEPMIANVQVTPLRNSFKQTVGLLYAVYDVTALRTMERDLLHVKAERNAANDKLQATNEALQAANKELETTNEELQSANEELQTTNEELQSANEELQTTNQELQSTNVELDATNRELAHRTEEMDVLSFYQRTIIRSLSAAVVVLDGQGRITLWNLAAERLLGLAEAEALGQIFWVLRIPAFRRSTTLQIRKALREERAFRADEMKYDLPTGGRGCANVAALPLIEGKSSMGAVILFEDITRFVKVAERRLREKIKTANRSRAADALDAANLSDRARSQADGAPTRRGAPGNASNRSNRSNREKRVVNGGAEKVSASMKVSKASPKKVSPKKASGKRPAPDKKTLS